MFVCANCGKEISRDEAYICRDNFLLVNFFENNRLNRFCSRECFCESLMLEQVSDDEIPLDDEEYAEEEEDSEE